MPARIGAAADGRGLVRGPDRAHVDHVREFSGVQVPQLMEWSALFIDRTRSDAWLTRLLCQAGWKVTRRPSARTTFMTVAKLGLPSPDSAL